MSEGVRAELREAADIRADVAIMDTSERWSDRYHDAMVRLLHDVEPLLAERDALAEQVAQAEDTARVRLGQLNDARERAARGVISVARAGQREARVRELHQAYDCTAAGEPEHENCGEREWCYSCGEDTAWPCPTITALDEGDTEC